MHIENEVCPPGSAIYIDGRTFYEFGAGPSGLRALNFTARQHVQPHHLLMFPYERPRGT
jgi:hypothetical protein